MQARQSFLAVTQLFDLVRISMAGVIDPNDPSTWRPDNVAGRFEYTVEEDLTTGKRITRIRTDPTSEASVAAGKELALTIANQTKVVMGKVVTDDPVTLAKDANERAALEEIINASLAERESPPKRPPIGTRIDPKKLPEYDRKKLLTEVWKGHHGEVCAKCSMRTVTDYTQKFNEFVAWIGDRPVDWVEKTDYTQFKTWLQRDHVSPCSGKRVAGIDVRSVDKYTTAISGFFKYAQNSGYFSENMVLPTAKQHIMSKSALKKRARKREANRDFKPEELAVAFDAETYIRENQLVHHFWPPLMALFTGARRAEVSQLLISDVRQESGHWVIDINDEEYKNVKNENACRMVPIHPTLIEIGFLEYLEEVKAAKRGKTLFPGITANQYGEKGNAVGNAWRRYLIGCGLRTKDQKEEADDTLTFHSLRHTAITLLRNAGVPYDIRCQMVGHDAQGQQGDYGAKASVTTIADLAFPQLVYPSIDFSKFHYQKGSLALKRKVGRKHRTKNTKGVVHGDMAIE